MRIFLKVILILFSTFVVLLGGFFLFLHIAFDGLFTGSVYNKQDLIENYEQRTAAIRDVKDYFLSILPEDAKVTVEFENNKELALFHVGIDSTYESNWNLKINSPKVDSLLTELRWTTKELKTLKKKLDKANCISIGGRDPVTIGWQRSGMGQFSYNLFNEPLDEAKIADYNDGCTYIFYKDDLVLEYGGGAIGLQCFPDYQNEQR